MDLFRRFLRDEAGATAIEYALIASLMAVAVVAAVGVLGPKLKTSFTNIGNCLTSNTCTAIN
jgi:pilus assembly protein Flp/PilA